MKVFGALVAREMRSAAARGEVADFVRARKGYDGKYRACIQERRLAGLTSRAFKAFVCSIFCFG